MMEFLCRQWLWLSLKITVSDAFGAFEFALIVNKKGSALIKVLKQKTTTSQSFECH